MDDFRLDVRLRHDKPVDLIDMANSLISLNNIAVSRIGKKCGIKDTKILLNGVKEGCDIYQLTFMFNHLMPVVETINTVAAFTDYIKSYIGVEKLPVEEIKDNDDFDINSAKSIKSLVKPLLNDDKSSLSIEIDGNNNIVNVFSISHNEAKKIDDSVELINKIKTDSCDNNKNNYFEKVLIKMHSTTDTEKKVKDKAYCDDILKGKAVATIFDNIDEKKEVLNDPYNNYYLVDIEVKTVDGVPRLYTVKKLHDIIPIN